MHSGAHDGQTDRRAVLRGAQANDHWNPRGQWGVAPRGARPALDGGARVEGQCHERGQHHRVGAAEHGRRSGHSGGSAEGWLLPLLAVLRYVPCLPPTPVAPSPATCFASRAWQSQRLWRELALWLAGAYCDADGRRCWAAVQCASASFKGCSKVVSALCPSLSTARRCGYPRLSPRARC
jgi:hypothetical protein